LVELAVPCPPEEEDDRLQALKSLRDDPPLPPPRRFSIAPPGACGGSQKKVTGLRISVWRQITVTTAVALGAAIEVS
jgi:hypothetical protein